MALLDIISISIGALYIIPIILYDITNNSRHLLALCGLLAITCISEFIKYNVIGELSIRPKGAKDCNLLCTDGKCEGKPGMPSTHSAIVSFFVGFYINQTENVCIQLILLFYAYLVMLSRHLKRCHTIYQIGTGSALGFAASFIVLKKTLMLKDI